MREYNSIQDALKMIDFEQCSGTYIYKIDGVFILDSSDAAVGIDLECVENSISMESAIEYIEDCI